MKRNTVITFVVLLLLSVLLLGFVPAGAQDYLSTPLRSNVITHEVRFYSDLNSIRVRLLVDDGSPIGTLPVVDENDNSWRWKIAGTDDFLTADMPITEDLNVIAFREEHSVVPDGDFIGGAIGVLVNAKATNIAVNASTSGLISCDLNNNCNPQVWHFEYIGNCVPDTQAKVGEKPDKFEYIGAGCQYYVVNDDGIYLKINNGSVGVSTSPVATLVRLHSNGNYTFNNGGGANSRLNVKNGVIRSSVWGDDGSQFYFGNSQLQLVTVQFNVNGGNVRAPQYIMDKVNTSVSLPVYTGTKSGHEFLGWAPKDTPDIAHIVPFTYTLTKDETLCAVFNTEPILWLDYNTGDTSDVLLVDATDGKVELPEPPHRSGYSFAGWAKDRNAESDSPDLIPAGTEYVLTAPTEFLYAVWAEASTVYFDGGDVVITPDHLTVHKGDVIDLTADISYEGSAPVKWFYINNEGETVDVEGTTFTALAYDVTLYGVWADEAFLTLDANGGAFGSGSREMIRVTAGDTVDLDQYMPVKGDKTFMGWSYSQHEDDKANIITGSFTVPADQAGKDIVLYAVWGNTVTFNNNVDNTVVAEETVIDGQSMDIPSYDGKKNNHPFVAWYTKTAYEDGGELLYPGASYTPTGSITFYAIYSSTIKFDAGGGTSVSHGSVTEPQGTVLDMTQYTAEYKYGTLEHDFLGWNTAYGKTAPTIPASYKVDANDKTFYAVWDTKSIVCYDANNSTDALTCFKSDRNAAVELSDGSDLTAPEGKHFAGWSYFKTQTTPDYPLDELNFVVPARDVTLYAIWQTNDIWISFDENGGDLPVETQKHAVGDMLVFPSYDGKYADDPSYTFLGWADTIDSLSVDHAVNSFMEVPNTDTTYYAVWQGPVVVNFDKNDGSGIIDALSGPHPSGSTLTLPTVEDIGERSGYVFKGWAIRKTNVTDVFSGGDGFVVPKRSVTLYAVWQPSTITVKFEKNGGNQNIPSVTAAYDGSDTDPRTFTVPGAPGTNGTKLFLGWSIVKNTAPDYRTDEVVAFPRQNMTLYAVWKDTITVSFNQNNGKGVDKNLQIQGKPGDVVTLDSKYDLTGKNGTLVFKGWSDGENTYQVGDTYTVPDYDATLYAVWEGPVYLRFNNNGGSIAAPDPILWDRQNDVVIPFYEGTKEGYTFIGWSEVSDMIVDSKYHTVYKPGDSFTFSGPYDKTLYAVWNQESQVAVKFGIRLDGRMPEEPGNFDASAYTTKYADKGGNVFVHNAILESKWVVDTTPDWSRVGDLWYVPNAITDNLVPGAIPSAQEVITMMRAADMDFNPRTQVVMWYVLKWQGHKTPYDYWHIDGVILDRAPYVTISYHQNIPDGSGNAQNMPLGFQVLEGTYIAMGADSEDGAPKVPTHTNYVFKCWNTDLYGTCDDSTAIMSGANFLLDQNTHVYGIWESKDTSTVDLQFTKTWNDNNNADGIRPSEVWLTLSKTADGQALESERVKLTGAMDAERWTIKFSRPKFDDHKNIITYSWAEDEIPGYENGTITYANNHLNGYVVNTHDYEKTELSGLKKWQVWDETAGTWVDEDSSVEHEPVTIILLANVNGKITPVEQAAASKDNGWAWSFTGLPKYHYDSSKEDKRTEIIYTVTDTAVLGYTSEFNPASGNLENRKTSIPIKVIKNWVDTGYEEARSDITVSLMQDGEAIQTMTMTKDDRTDRSSEITPVWMKSFPEYVDSTAGYTVTEGNVPAYYTAGEPEKVNENTYRITNTIKAVTVTITGESAEITYDGQQHTIDGFTVEISDPSLYSESDITFGGTASKSGTNAGTYAMGLTAEQFSNKRSDIYVKFVVNDGVLKINPAEVTVDITGHNDSVYYDGNPHTVEGYDVTSIKIGDAETTLYTEDDFTFSGTDSVTETAAGTYPMGLSGEQFTNLDTQNFNVTFNVTDGELEIKPVAAIVVTIKGNTETVTYDGETHTVTGYTIEKSDPLYPDNAIAFSGTASVSGSAASGTAYPMGLAEGQFTNTNPNFDVTFVVEDGWLKIDPAVVTVTITEPSDEVNYDGGLHQVDGYNVTSIKIGDADTTLYTTADFRFSGTDHIEGTNAGSYPMELTADNFTNNNTNFTVNFVIVNGQLVIKPIDVTVTITGNNNTTSYDGENHTVTGYIAVADNQLYNVRRDFTFTPAEDAVLIDGVISASRTNVVEGEDTDGKTVMGLATNQFQNTNTNFRSVTFIVADGYQEITPIDVTVTITGNNNTTSYDGNSHTVKDYTALADNELYDVTKDFKFTPAADAVLIDGVISATRTDAGTTNMGLKKEQFENTNPNFGTVTFNVTDGFQTINKINVTVTIVGNIDTKTYDGDPHSAIGYTATTENTLYNVETDFTFTPAAGATLIDGVIAATRTQVGTTPMGLAAGQFANINPNFENVTFDVTDGYITITSPSEVVVTIAGNYNTSTYDGEFHTVSGYDVVSISNTAYTVNDFVFNGTAQASRKFKGTTNMGLTSDQFVNQNTNFANVRFVVTDGYQTITPIAITITSGTGSKVYDGQALTVHEINEVSGLVGGDQVSVVSYNSSRTEPGSVDNVISGAVIMNGEENVTEGYDIRYAYGTLTVTKKQVVIKAMPGSKDYDGTIISSEDYGWYYPDTNTPIAGDMVTTISYAYGEGNRINPGTYTTTPSGARITRDGTDVTDFYEITYQSNELVINPKQIVVTIVGRNSNLPYDGTEHKVEGYDVTISSTLYTENDFHLSPSVTAEAARTDKGTTYMGLTPYTFINDNENFSVEFQVTDGFQTITPIDVVVTITGRNNTTDYDGHEHRVSGYDVVEFSNDLYKASYFTFEPDADVTLDNDHVVTAARTDAGTTYMHLKPGQFSNINPNFGNVEFIVTDGYQTINKIDVTVTITGHTSTVDYDGKSHTVQGYDTESSSTLYTDADFTFSGTDSASRTYVVEDGDESGKTNMGLEASQFTNTNPNFNTVTFNVTDGYQEITPINVTVTITGHTSTVEYDGTAHSVAGYDVKISDELYQEADFTFSGTAEASRTNVVEGEDTDGQTDMGLAAAQFTNTNPNFAAVTFDVTDGYQKITPINVTVTIVGANNTAEYNGSEHKVEGYKVTNISSDLYTTADFTFSGTAEASRTNVVEGGDTDGQTDMGLTKDNFTNTNPNFIDVTFDVKDGYQKITPIDVTVTIVGAHNTAPYDGEEHRVSGYEVTEISNPLYTEEDFSFSGTAVAARTIAGTTNMDLNKNQFTNTNTNFKDVTFSVTDGYQTITAVDEVVVTITGHHNTTGYDGKAHNVSGYEVSISNPLYTEADFTFSGTAEASRTNVVEGEDTDGKTDMGLTKENFSNNDPVNFPKVTFVVVDGYQEITPIDVTVTVVGANNTAPYDGTAHSVSGYEVTAISNPLYTEEDFEFSGTAEASRTNVVEGEDTDGQTDMGLAAAQFTNTNPNFGTVTFDVTDGYQKITPIDVTVTIVGAHNTAPYDGEEHRVSGYEVTEISNPLYKEADFTFEGTAAAARTVAGTTNMNLNQSQFTNTNRNFGTVTFNVTDGYQTITPVDEVVVTITGHYNTSDYDGSEHSVAGYDVEISNPLYTEAYFTFSGTAAAARTNVVEGEDTDGKTDMGLTKDNFTNINTETFPKVTFVVKDGYQEIKPINVTVTIVGAGNTAEYDGAPHSVSGYEVTGISSDLYTTADFTFSGTAEASRTNVVEGEDTDGQTDMGLIKDNFTNTNPNFTNVTFDVTDGYQKITPINVTVTITGHNDTDPYDGSEHSVTGYDVDISNPLYTEEDFSFSGTAAAARTIAGTTNMELDKSQFTNNNTNFTNVTFNVTDGYQTITPVGAVVVTITGRNHTDPYDGSEHSVSGYDVSISNPLYTEEDFEFSGTAEAARTNVVEGEDADGKTIMGLTKDNFSNNDPVNFPDVTFVVIDGYQEITPIDVTVTIAGDNNTAPYDGAAHSVSGYEVTAISNPLYTEEDFEFSGTAEASRTNVVEGEDTDGQTDMGLAAAQFTNTNPNFGTVTFDVTDGYQKITPIDVTVTIVGANNTSAYNGTAHTVSGYTPTASTTLYDVENDFTFSGTAAASRTNVVEGEDADGQTDMGLTAAMFTNTNPNFGTVTFDVTDGYQKITPLDVTVTIVGANNTAPYDKTEHSVSDYTATASTSLYDVENDFTFTPAADAALIDGVISASRTDVGTTNMGLAAGQFANTNTNFGTVTFTVTDGYQTITPIKVTVTITGHYNTTDYDGKEHSVSGYDVSFSTPVYTADDFSFNGNDDAARTDAGTTNMGLAVEQFTNTNPNFNNEDVTFVVTDGYQTINPITVTVNIYGAHNTSAYDGTEHTVTGYAWVPSTNLYTKDDFKFTGEAKASRTNVAEGEEYSDWDYGFEDDFGYDFDDEIFYEDWSNGDIIFIDDGSDEVVIFAGRTNMGLSASQFENISKNFSSVIFNVTDGYQAITPISAEVTVVGNNNTTNYDGDEHEVVGFTATVDTPLYNANLRNIVETYYDAFKAARTDAGTTDMGLTETFFNDYVSQNKDQNFETVTFHVTDGYQTINPINVTVTITGHKDVRDYDGTEHSVSGYDVTSVRIGDAETTLYTEDDFTFSGSAIAARTNVVEGEDIDGETPMGLVSGQFTNKNTNFGTVTFEVEDGSMTINPIDVEVTIVGKTDTIVYDGKEHAVYGYTATADSDLYDVAHGFTFSGKAEAVRTEVGKTDMGLNAEQFANTDTNFAIVTFTVTDGYQQITPLNEVVVTITGHNNTSKYDGAVHTVSGYDVAISDPLYTVEDFTFSGNATASRTNVVEGTDNDGQTDMGLTEAQFTNTNPNFDNVKFVVIDGYQKINPISVIVTITGHTASSDYDGKAHNVSGYEVSFSNDLYTADDFKFSGTAAASRTDAGITNMGLLEKQFTNTNPNFTDVYFDVTDGYQEITPISVKVTITGHTDTKPFDGGAHSAEGYDVEISNPLYKETDFSFSGLAVATRTDVGTTNMKLEASKFANTNPNFTNVEFDVTDGSMTITPIDIVVTIVGANNTTDYDGTAHTVSGYEVSFSNPLYTAADFTFSGTAEAARTDVGTTYMELSADQFANINPNFGTVTFVVTDGYQTVDPIDVVVTIVGANNTTDYDGTAHTVTGYTATADTTLYNVDEDFTFSGSKTATRTDAGQTDMGLKPEQFTNRNTNFRTVTFEVTDGYQKIDPIDVVVTIVGANNTTDYDGAEHKVTGYTATANTGLYNVNADFSFSGTAEAARTNVVEDGDTDGQTDMGLAADQFENTNPNFATVTFKVTDGYQKINPINVTVTIVGNSNTTDYDGTEHTVTDYTATADTDLYNVETDFDFSGTAEASRTNAGTTNMGLEPGQFTNKNPNFATVTFNVTDGYQTIDPIDVTVTIIGHNSTVDYDNSEHSVSGYEVEFSSPLYTEEDFSFEGTDSAVRTDAGTTNMGLEPGQFTNKNPNFANVTFNVTDGYQKINPIGVVVTITEHSGRFDYNGTAHIVSGYDVAISDPLYIEEDFDFSGNAVVSGTNAGTYDMDLKASDFANANPNFTNVTFVIVDGQLVIDPIDVTVTITGANTTADYDGTEHSVSGYTAASDSNLYDVTKDFTFSGTAEADRTDAGTTGMGLKPEQFENTNPNFRTVTFVVTDGSLTINPIDVTVTITGHHNVSVYDSNEHSISGYDVEIEDPLYTEDDFEFTGTATAARTYVGTTNMGLAPKQFVNHNDNFANVIFIVTDGYQEITPVDEVIVTITGHHNTAAYNGEEHSVRGYEVEISDPLYTISDFTFSGTAEAARTNVVEDGDTDGQTDMGLTEAQFENTNPNFANVVFIVTDGYQMITPIHAVVNIVGNNNTTDYDGTEHTVTGYTATADNDLYNVREDFTFSGTAEASRTYVVENQDTDGQTDMGLTEAQFENKNPNFATVIFNVTDGYQKINPIDVVVTIVGANNTAYYDGNEHKVTGYTAEADNDLYDVTKDFTFSGKAEAARTYVVEHERETQKRAIIGRTYMGLAEYQFENTNPNFRIVTFNVTDGYQQILPIDVVVTIVGENNTTSYDGKAHTVSGYTATADNALYNVDKDFTFSGHKTATRTDAGTTSMGLTADAFFNANMNFANVTFLVTDGYQTITPIDVIVTITEHSGRYDYNGKSHTVSGYDVSISDPLYTEADFTFSGNASVSGTNAGTYDMDLKASDFANANPNFSNVIFEIVDGQLVIDPIDVTVTITGRSNTAAYDGEEHSVSGYDAAADSDLFDVSSDISFTGNDYAAGTDAGTTYMGLMPDQFSCTNPNFRSVTFVVTDGYQTITPIDVEVTIVGNNSTVNYDSFEHIANGYKVTVSNPLYTEDDFSFSGTAHAARTDVGTTDMGLAADQFSNKNPNFANVTFRVTDGYQKIEPIDVVVTIVGAHNSTNYDGEEHKVTGYTAAANTSLYNVNADFSFSGNAEAVRTNAGTTNMGLAASQFANTNPNFRKVTFVVTDGYQTITPIAVKVTITGSSNVHDYDGKGHKVTGYEVTADSDLFDETTDLIFNGTDTASRTDAGTTEMGLSADQFRGNNSNFILTFEVIDGYQTINPIDVTVTITGHSDVRVYNARKHTVKGYDVQISNPLYTEADFTFSGKAEVSRTEVGVTSMGLAVDQFANTNPNFATVTFRVVDGVLTITPLDQVVVTITGHNSTVDYDGTEHGVRGYDVKISHSLYTEDDFTFIGTEESQSKNALPVAEAFRTDVGTTSMGLAQGQFRNINENFSNVTFIVNDGYQAILPINVEVRIKGHHGSFVYDGEEHVVTGYEVVDISNPLYTEADFSFSGTDSVSRTNVIEGEDTDGKTDMGLAANQFTNNNKNFAKVTFIVEDGSVEITPKPVKVIVNSVEKQYGQNDEPFTAEVEGVLNEDEIDYSISRQEGEEAGTYPIIASGDELQGNYKVEYVPGTMTIIWDPTSATVTKVWDDVNNQDGIRPSELTMTLSTGQTVTLTEANGWTATIGELPVYENGQVISYTWSETVVPAGYEMTGMTTEGTATTVTNRHSPDVTSYSVQKIWVDDENRDGLRPVSLAVTLNGSDGYSRTVRLSDENGWSAEIGNLPVYFENGTAIVYEWTEENVSGYTLETEVNGHETILTNTHEIFRTQASVSKTWLDNNNAGGNRPASLNVILSANGGRLLGVVLNEANGWNATVTNLPVNANGRPIEYTWAEQTVGGGYYATSVRSGNNTAFTNSSLYTLTIHYVYDNGETAWADYQVTLAAGQVFNVDSPVIAEYIASLLAVTGTQPARNIEFTVVYVRSGSGGSVPVPTVTPTPTPTPDVIPVPTKDIPEQRIVEPDEEHPIVVPLLNTLIDIEDLETALGLGEVFITGGGFSLE